MAPQIHSDQGYKARYKLFVDTPLIHFIERELLPDSGISQEQFYESLATLVQEFGKTNRLLLKKRLTFKDQIDQWHTTRRQQGIAFDSGAFEEYLQGIGYIIEVPETVQVSTENVDPELATIAGPQLVVPVKNARFALNAANARWGSLYNALYGTDAIPGKAGKGYDTERGDQVIRYAKNFLDEQFPLQQGSHHDVCRYQAMDNGFAVELKTGAVTTLAEPEKFCGFQGDASKPSSILLKNNDLHVDIQIDPEHFIGRTDSAHVKDVVLESAITAIQDFEDSVAAVDAEDKAEVYRNMLGLYKGDLSAELSKGGKSLLRTLEKDREYRSLSGETFCLPGRSTLLIRNVGHLMTTPAVLDDHCCEIPEGILDALVTAVIAHYDLRKTGADLIRNSRSGSVYIVKPKMQGPEEVAFCNDLFARVEQLVELPRNTLKVGIMDEEHRTTLNLKACIAAAAQERVIFINTGFLDRTGSEMHVNMEAGPMVPKTEMKHQQWIKSYENWNVDIGLQCGLADHAQIGKGMWAMPDDMADMLKAKIAHPRAGANCAWVPSPTAATLHVLHYHKVNVREVQTSLEGRQTTFRDLLEVPVMANSDELDAATIQRELENNAQGILGYVVRWIDQGVGCSKVPDIHNVNLMEDRATLRISAQHIANWLHFGICSEEQVHAVFNRMAAIVDKQNENTEGYTPLCADLDNSTAYKAALSLVFEGMVQPSGYTEPLLHKYRYRLKHQRELGSYSKSCPQPEAEETRETIAEV